jgi:hypothetical protein
MISFPRNHDRNPLECNAGSFVANFISSQKKINEPGTNPSVAPHTSVVKSADFPSRPEIAFVS